MVKKKLFKVPTLVMSNLDKTSWMFCRQHTIHNEMDLNLHHRNNPIFILKGY